MTLPVGTEVRFRTYRSAVAPSITGTINAIAYDPWDRGDPDSDPAYRIATVVDGERRIYVRRESELDPEPTPEAPVAVLKLPGEALDEDVDLDLDALIRQDREFAPEPVGEPTAFEKGDRVLVLLYNDDRAVMEEKPGVIENPIHPTSSNVYVKLDSAGVYYVGRRQVRRAPEDNVTELSTLLAETARLIQGPTEPTDEDRRLNVLAQRFYEASGLTLSHTGDKPAVVRGLRGVIDAALENSRAIGAEYALVEKREVGSHTHYHRTYQRSSVPGFDEGPSAQLRLTHGTRGIALAMNRGDEFDDHEARGVLTPDEARDLAAELVARADDIDRRQAAEANPTPITTDTTGCA